MLSSLFRRSKVAGSPFDITKNPWRAKRKWPPDFNELSQKEQFRFERRFRRRHKLKWMRPTWTKAIKITQWGSITIVLAYAIFIYEDPKKGSRDQPFAFAREWYNDSVRPLLPSFLGGIASPPRPRNDQGRQETP